MPSLKYWLKETRGHRMRTMYEYRAFLWHGKKTIREAFRLDSLSGYASSGRVKLAAPERFFYPSSSFSSFFLLFARGRRRQISYFTGTSCSLNRHSRILTGNFAAYSLPFAPLRPRLSLRSSGALFFVVSRFIILRVSLLESVDASLTLAPKLVAGLPQTKSAGAFRWQPLGQNCNGSPNPSPW